MPCPYGLVGTSLGFVGKGIQEAPAGRCLCWRMGSDFFQEALHSPELISVGIPGDFHYDVAYPRCGVVLDIGDYIFGIPLQG